MAEILAPMPGVVVDVAVAVDDLVSAGDLLMTLESMKLQTAIHAPEDARVAELYLEAGASFDQGTALVRLEATNRASENPPSSKEKAS